MNQIFSISISDKKRILGTPSATTPSPKLRKESQIPLAGTSINLVSALRIKDIQASVRVVARIRPANEAEKKLEESGLGGKSYELFEEKMLFFPSEKQSFTLDEIFGEENSQERIYSIVGKETVKDVLNGYNGTIIAYGQTGSGKTFTMFGIDVYDDTEKGIIPRAAVEIFDMWNTYENIQEIEIKCSMMELYKEGLKDLLADRQLDLKIKESPQLGIFVEGISEIPLSSPEELMYYIDFGQSRRVWAETKHNAVSSRSHSIFRIEVLQKLTNGSEKRGILNLVDLAGSEKVGKIGAQGQQFEEGTKQKYMFE